MTKVTAEKIRRKVYLITAKNEDKQVEFEFKITWWVRLSSKCLTKAIKELKKEFVREGIEIPETKLYDKILRAYHKKLPPLLLTYY